MNLQNKFGFNKDDVLAVSLPNAPEFPIAALGAIEAGLVVTSLNPIYTAGTIHIIKTRTISTNLYDKIFFQMKWQNKLLTVMLK